MKLVTVTLLFLSGCIMYKPELSEKHQALQLIDQGAMALRRGNFEEAEATFETAYEVGQLPAALDGLGSVCLLKGDLDQAERFFKAAYNSGAHYPSALGNLALLNEQKGNYEAAKRLYLQALAEDPTNYKIRGNFAAFLAEYKGENFFQAKRELLKARAIKNDPLLKHNQTLLEKG